MKRLFALFLSLCCLYASALATDSTAVQPYPLPEGGTEIVLTFGGDSTLGSEDYLREEATSFVQMVNQHGYAYPFEKMYPLFSTDDVTVVNLEGAFYDSTAGKVTKTYNFRAPTEFARILPLGSVEAVMLGNNHTIDYGQAGFDSTVAALEKENVAWFVDSNEANKTWIYEKNGIKIGFAGYYIGYWRANIGKVRESLQALRDAGCATIIGSMHGGSEYAQKHNNHQAMMADTLIQYGASVVMGHHPHVVQGVEVRNNATVAYSLGNLSFGGNKRIKNMADTALVTQVRLVFDKDQKYLGHQMTIYPIHPTGTFTKVNDYRPIFATGEEAQRIMALVQADTPYPLAPYVEGKGALQPFVPAPPPLPGPPDPMDLYIKIEPM